MVNWIKYWWQQCILVSVIFLLTIQPCYAIKVSNVPTPKTGSYIVDLANLLDTDTEAEINSAIATLEQQKHKTIYVVTVPEVPTSKTKATFKIIPSVSSSRRFLESLLLNWNLEQFNQGNAMLLLVSKTDHSIEIKSGSNLKYIIRDNHIQGVIDKIIIPKFKHHEFKQGISSGMKALITKIDNPYYSHLPISKRYSWQSQQIAECKARNIPGKYGYSNCPDIVSYYGGSGKW